MRGVVQVVTGGGKTIFSQMCMEHFIEQHSNGIIVIIVPTSALVDQWFISLIEDLHVSSEEIACFSGEEKPDNARRFNIIVINTARTLASKISGSLPSMLVVDECHRAGSPANSDALGGAHLATLGLSATPEREYDDGFEKYIVPALGPVIYNYDYSQAARDGVISKFALHNVFVEMLPDERDRFDKFSRSISAERARIKRGNGSEQRLRVLMQRRAGVSASARMRIPVAVKLLEANPRRRTIIFHERVESADTLYSIIGQRGGSVTVYHAGIAAALRRDNLRLYRRGVFDILVCCRALDEGINVPETSLAIIASATASARQRIQRLGRVLRPAPGKNFADVYTIYASKMEESRLALEADRYSDVCDVTWAKVTSKYG